MTRPSSDFVAQVQQATSGEFEMRKTIGIWMHVFTAAILFAQTESENVTASPNNNLEESNVFGQPGNESSVSTDLSLSRRTSPQQTMQISTNNYGKGNFPKATVREDSETIGEYNTSEITTYQDYAGKITLPIALVIGSIGNSVTIATMSTKPFRYMTWSIILTSLAVADNVVLLAVPFNKPFVIDFIGADLPSVNSASCKIYNFIRRASKMVSAWLIVLVCFERFIAVCFPLKVKRICTRTRTVISIVCVVLASSAYCSIWITTADIVDGLCIQTIVTPESQKKAMLLIVIGSVLIVVLPMAIMLVLTPITCVVLRRHMVLRSQISSASGQNEGYIKATAMLISLSVTYVILLTPAMVSYNLAFSRKESLVTTRDTTLIIIRELSQVLELINYSSNFFLYTAFNDIFRDRILQWVTCKARTADSATEATSCTQSNQISMTQASNNPGTFSNSNTNTNIGTH